MTHGRNHDERRFKAQKPRANNMPEDDELVTDLEAELSASGRGGVRPRQGVIGPYEERGSMREWPSEDGEAPPQMGSTVAPTRQAEIREHERHRLEREAGRVAAGTEGVLRARQEPGVSREALDQAAQAADRYVAEEESPTDPMGEMPTEETELRE
jgi:hypothetical protein